MPTRNNTADVIVIGAGAIGCNTAWHLARAGADVLVLEAGAGPASQSTGAAAGFVASWAGLHIPTWGITEWRMQQYGIEFYRGIAAQHANAEWLAPHGIAYIFLDPQHWLDAQPRIAQLRSYGSPVSILDQQSLHERLPLLDPAQLAGVVYDSSAIRVRAADAIGAVAEDAARLGARFYYQNRMQALTHHNGRITGVHTAQGDYDSNQVVIAAGAWSRPILTNLGIACAANPLVETRYVTTALGVPSGMPLLIFSDCHGFYIREERGGLLIGGGEPHPLPPDRGVDAEQPPLAADLPPDQAYRLREYLRKAERAMPILRNAEIDTIRSGLPTFTSDLRFIVDQLPGYEGAWVATACQEAGVTHGPAIGKLLSQLALGQQTTWDCSTFRLHA
jgi:sarcosine oxidase, subunit beta